MQQRTVFTDSGFPIQIPYTNTLDNQVSFFCTVAWQIVGHSHLLLVFSFAPYVVKFLVCIYSKRVAGLKFTSLYLQKTKFISLDMK